MALKRFIYALVAWCVGASAAVAQPEPIHPALYVTRDADSTLYLFGTVHVRPSGAPWGGPEAQAALTSADEVWTETEISAEAEEEARAVIARLGTAPPDQPLSSHLEPEAATRLRKLADELDIPMAQLETMQPWLASIILSIEPSRKQGYASESGVDRTIDRMARAEGKRLRGLETAEDQFRFVATLPPETQREMLLDAIDTAEGAVSEMQLLMQAWEQGDLSVLESLVVDEMQARYPDLYDAVIVQRNAAWVEQLVREMEGAGVDFVAVGAAHLVGADSVLSMLEARGFAVERVSPAE